MGLISEFREFAVKGNMVDMAVGIIVGAAFGKVVTSLVGDVIMPPVGMAMGHVDFKDLQVVLKDPSIDPISKAPIPAVAIKYGLFLNNVIDFVIVALCIFLVVKAMNKVIAKREAAKPA